VSLTKILILSPLDAAANPPKLGVPSKLIMPVVLKVIYDPVKTIVLFFT
jgi:hypothetical protein